MSLLILVKINLSSTKLVVNMKNINEAWFDLETIFASNTSRKTSKVSKSVR